MHYRLFVCFLLTYCFPLVPISGQTISFDDRFVDQENGMSLSDLMKAAEQSNVDIQSALRRVEEAKALRRQAGARPNPEFQISGGSSSILADAGDREWTASYTHTFELGSKRGKRIAAAEVIIEIAEQEALDQKRKAFAEIRQLYAELLRSIATLAVTEEALNVHQRLHEITTARVREGEAAAMEQGLSLVELNRLQADVAALTAEVNRSFANLKKLTGAFGNWTKVEGRFAFEENAPFQDVELMIYTSRQRRPDLKIAMLQQRLAEAEISGAKAERIPNLDASLEFTDEKTSFDQLGLDDSGRPVALVDHDKILSAGISFQLPFFNRNQGNIQAGAARLQSARARNRYLDQAIEQEVKSAVERARTAAKNYELFRDQIVQRSKQHVEVLRASYQAGELRFLDLLNEQKRAIEIRKAFIEAAKEYSLAVAELKFVTAAGAGE